jgi:exopolysaccharide biosynthesis WecB/TagA/CpsF family protein
MKEKIEFLDIEFTSKSLANIVSGIEVGIFDNKIIVTPNVDHIVRYNYDVEFKSIYDEMDVFLNDSKVLLFLSKINKNSLHFVTPGSDITKSIFQSINSFSHYNFVIIGATTTDIDNLKINYPETLKKNIIHVEPSYGFIKNHSEVSGIVKFCEELPNSIYFICVGSPQQEILAKRLRDSKVQGVFLCVGASILFLSGSEKRAPVFLQKIGFEWFYRFLNSPIRLFKRYFIHGFLIFIIIYRYKFNS